MEKQKNLLLLGSILFTSFVFLSVLVFLGALTSLDFDTTLNLQNKLPSFLTSFFSVFSILGTVETASLILLISLLIFSNLRKITVLILYAMTGLIEVVGKLIIEQKGPPIEFLKTNLSLNFPSGNIPHEFFSYPSGHAARTAFISAVLLFAIWKSPKLSKELKYAFAFCVLAFDFVMFVSRVYLGEHWTSDVIGGALLGFSLSIIAIFGLKRIKSA